LKQKEQKQQHKQAIKNNITDVAKTYLSEQGALLTSRKRSNNVEQKEQ
jgi:hypothetical protein